MPPPASAYKITTATGVAIVMANMIGTGAFTSLGFQLKDLNSTLAVLTLWVVGGVLALAGAFSYAEVGTAIQKSGGEYAFLSRIYHPLIGYLSGWISLTVGFAAPVALSAIAFVAYFPFGQLPPQLTSIALVAAITWVHSRTLRTSSTFQNISTLFKVGLIGALILTGLFLPGQSGQSFGAEATYFTEVGSAAFAVALIYVSYSYSGWNAAAYITEEFANPVRSLPIALVGGTALVTVLYTLLQYVFMRHVPLSDLAGQLDVGAIAATHMLGQQAGDFFGMAISLLLVSGISAMVWVGPRVTSSMATQHRLWHYFRTAEGAVPTRALWLQFGVSALLLLTGTFEQIMIYCGILLTVSTMLVVLGVFLIRRDPAYRDAGGYRSPWFPLFQVLFLLLSAWVVVFAFIHNTFETVVGMANLLVGLGTYYWSERR